MMLDEIKGAIKLLRPYQWYKNLLVFAAMFFSGSLFSTQYYGKVVVGFIAASLTSGASYAINDIIDAERDKRNPEKRSRPIPSGRISKQAAKIIALFSFSLSAAMGALISLDAVAAIASLFFIHQLYSLFLKERVLLDVFGIASGYVVRGILGLLLIRSELSFWFFLGIFFVALLLALGKRKAELFFLGNNAAVHRNVYASYQAGMLDHMVTMISTLTIIFYAFYCIIGPWAQTNLFYTIPFIVFLVMRYHYILFSGKDIEGRKPELLFKDKQLAIAGLSWLFLSTLLIYS